MIEEEFEYDSFASFYISAHGATTNTSYMHNFEELKENMQAIAFLSGFTYMEVGNDDFASLFQLHMQSLLFNVNQGNDSAFYDLLDKTKEEYSIYVSQFSLAYKIAKQLKNDIITQNRIPFTDIQRTISNYKLSLSRIELISNLKDVCHIYIVNYQEYILPIVTFFFHHTSKTIPNFRKAFDGVLNDLQIMKETYLKIMTINADMEKILCSVQYLSMTNEEFELFYQQISLPLYELYQLKRTITREITHENKQIRVTDDLYVVFYLFRLLQLVILYLNQNRSQMDQKVFESEMKKYQWYLKILETDNINPWLRNRQHFMQLLKVEKEYRPWKEENHDPYVTHDMIFGLKEEKDDPIDTAFGINTLLAVKLNNAILSHRQRRQSLKKSQSKSKKSKTRKQDSFYSFSDNVTFTPSLNQQQCLIDATLGKSGTKVVDDKRFRHIGIHKNFAFFLNMFMDTHCHCGRDLKMLLKNNIKRHYNKMKKDDRIKFDSRIFPPQLQDNTMKSRVLDFVCLLQLIIKNKRIHLSHLIYLFQYLIGFEFVSFVIPSCRSFLQHPSSLQTITRRGGAKK